MSLATVRTNLSRLRLLSAVVVCRIASKVMDSAYGIGAAAAENSGLTRNGARGMFDAYNPGGSLQLFVPCPNCGHDHDSSNPHCGFGSRWWPVTWLDAISGEFDEEYWR